MEDNLDIPEESMRHIEALLARHPPHLIQRMPQLYSLVIHVYQHREFIYNILVRVIMAVSAFYGIDILFIYREQRYAKFHCFLFVIALQDEEGGAAFLPSWS
ncbi:hypothetical protein J4E93_000949 [Alternaria ventricosa]|uniref:uncharacterized protein n=1 Tax=Alternaria ventricosa TaxID=1187951 RepID=UPI0020C50641|nr:uncharacterized protein J4E93_000949 [Alternaria ventricosa]KAI4656230.1 hypothetical protein J4E93_000949 [Alternaria ventricosa]